MEELFYKFLKWVAEKSGKYRQCVDGSDLCLYEFSWTKAKCRKCFERYMRE